MSFNHYYQSEFTALRQLGRRFAERSPALTPFLGQVGCDPDVECLLEDLAFLTGQLRQKLNDELSELSHSMMHLLWSNYMRPLLVLSILQFDPLTRPGGVLRVEYDTPAKSRSVGEATYRSRIRYATEVPPLVLEALNYSVTGEEALFGLRLVMNCNEHLGELGLSRLRLHLASEHYISQMFYLYLLRNLESIQLTPLDAHGRPLDGVVGKPMSLRLTDERVQPVGSVEDEALIPYLLDTFRGYRYLQEYFAFQDKFPFVDIDGLDPLGALLEGTFKQVRDLELRFDICKSGAQCLRLTLENVKLYHTPVANPFRHDALPIHLDGRQDEYLLVPAEYGLEDCRVFSVEGVAGWRPGGLGYQAYVPFESFEHGPSFDVLEARPHYSVQQRISLLHDGLDTYLSFGIRYPEQIETLSVELTCTNQNPLQRLRLGDICVACEDTSEFLSFHNITPTTPNYAPSLNRDSFWKLISNISLDYLSLANVDALKVILEIYDLPRHYDQHAARVSRCLLGGLKAIRHEHVDRLHRGLPLRGLRTGLTTDPEGHIGEDDLSVFAPALNESFALYASINSHHELRVRST